MAERTTWGGFFPLEFRTPHIGVNSRIAHLKGATPFYNARSAISALISSNPVRDVLLPHYICPVVIQAVEQAGATMRFFPINPDFTFNYKELAQMARDGSLLVIPCYFGVRMPDLDALASIRSQTGCRLLLDYAQALYEPCADGFAAVYSPRKFLGVPDGGFLAVGGESGLKTPGKPERKVETSVFGDRLACHGIRLEYPGENCLDSFRLLENNMPCGNIRMSDMAMGIFKAFDHDSACERRLRNYETLAACLGKPLAESTSVPLCFPLPIAAEDFDSVRRHLIENGVFIPFYWPGQDEWMRPGRGVLAFPVDHRYDSADMAAVSELAEKFIQGRSG